MVKKGIFSDWPSVSVTSIALSDDFKNILENAIEAKPLQPAPNYKTLNIYFFFGKYFNPLLIR